MVNSVALNSAWPGEADCMNCQLRSTVLFAGLEVLLDKEYQHDAIAIKNHLIVGTAL